VSYYGALTITGKQLHCRKYKMKVIVNFYFRQFYVINWFIS